MGSVHLDETRARVFLGEADDSKKMEGWYLDTGASNHMTGCRDAFSEPDHSVAGDVRFGDGSVVEICGRGTVIFSGRNGEHKAFSDVYYIPRLKNSNISVGQLDEGGSKVNIEEGVMRIWDRQNHSWSRWRAGAPCYTSRNWRLRSRCAWLRGLARRGHGCGMIGTSI